MNDPGREEVMESHLLFYVLDLDLADAEPLAWEWVGNRQFGDSTTSKGNASLGSRRRV